MTAYICVGIPSPFTHWVERVLVELLEASGFSAEVSTANTLDELAYMTLRTQTPHVVVQIRQMTPPLRAALATTGKRFVVILDNPLSAFCHLHSVDTVDLIAKTRIIAWGCASVLDVASSSNALKVHAVFNSFDLVATTMSIADWFGFNIDIETAAHIVSKLPTPKSLSAEEPVQEYLREFDPTESRIIVGAIGGYVDWFAGKGLGQLTWSRELFFTSDLGVLSAGGTVELTGPVRHLLYGPYIALPAASWTATVAVAFSKEAAGLSYSVEIIAGQASKLAAMTLYPDRAGTFEASTLFSVNDKTDQPISLRITNTRAAIEGKLSLVQVAMVPVRVEKTELPTHIAVALDL